MLAHLLGTGDVGTALRVADGSLAEYWLTVGGQLTEARSWLDRWGLNGGHSTDLLSVAFVRHHRHDIIAVTTQGPGWIDRTCTR